MSIGPTSEIIAKYLADNNIGTIAANTGWSITTNKDPIKPDSAITIYDTGGQRPVLYDEQILNKGIQIRTRSLDYRNNYSKQEEIFDLLNSVKSQMILNNFYIIGIWLTSDFIYVMRDDKERHIITSNYNLQISNSLFSTP